MHIEMGISWVYHGISMFICSTLMSLMQLDNPRSRLRFLGSAKTGSLATNVWDDLELQNGGGGAPGRLWCP